MLLGEWVRLLKQCTGLAQAKELHARVSSSKLMAFNRVFLSNLVVEMYGRCGSLDEAKRAFDGIQSKNPSSLSSMIKSYSFNNQMQEAKKLFDRMPLLQDVLSHTTLVAAFAAQGQVEEALEAFESAPSKDVVAWNAMLFCYAHNSRMREAGSCFDLMTQRNLVSCTTMVSACAMHGDVQLAKNVFDGMQQRNVVSWITMLHAYAEHGSLDNTRDFYTFMPFHDRTSSTTIISAYGSKGCVDQAKLAFDLMPDQDTPSWSAMLNAYICNNRVEEARLLFDEMPKRDVVSWNSMVTGYAQVKHMEAALTMFERMPSRDMVSWAVLFTGYSQNGHLEQAEQLADRIRRGDEVMVGTDLKLCNAMLVAYARNGHLDQARGFFESIQGKDVFSWTTMLAAYALEGRYLEALNTMRYMQLEGVEPNVVSFLCLLVACSHGGTVSDGRDHFLSMRFNHGIEPAKEHYCSMVDLLARAGHLQEAEELTGNMPYRPDEAAWHALLGACRQQKDSSRARRIAGYALRSRESSSSSYLLFLASESSSLDLNSNSKLIRLQKLNQPTMCK